MMKRFQTALFIKRIKATMCTFIVKGFGHVEPHFIDFFPGRRAARVGANAG